MCVGSGLAHSSVQLSLTTPLSTPVRTHRSSDEKGAAESVPSNEEEERRLLVTDLDFFFFYPRGQ